MPKNAETQPSPELWRAALVGIAALTLYRIVLLGFSTADLFVDEAQYWVWGQNLDWGYYSKPPLIGWVLRAVTDLAGSSDIFWVRLPGAVLHGISALILMGAAREVMGKGAAGLVGLAYVTMPSVTIGSFLISTDTILMPFFAGAVWIWLRLVRGPNAALAVGLGLCLGLGMMAKYAAIYFLLGAGLGVLFLPQARIAWRDGLIAAGVFLLVFGPNILWNLQNDLATLSHTADNVDWVRKPGLSLNVSGAVEFFAAQFGVFGPVLFGTWLVALVLAFRSPDWQPRWLVAMSAPIIALVTVQALLSRAYANWAVMACAGILLLAVPLLAGRLRWLFWLGLVFNLALALAVPVLTTQATTLRPSEDARLLMRRYVGRAELSRIALDHARAQGLSTIVADDRDMLADLLHTGRGSGITILAQPHADHAPHYFAQKLSLPAGYPGDVLYLGTSAQPPCPAPQIAEHTAGPGAYAGRTIRFYVAPGSCWDR